MPITSRDQLVELRLYVWSDNGKGMLKLGDPAQPTWGSWAGRLSPRADEYKEKRFYRAEDVILHKLYWHRLNPVQPSFAARRRK